MKPLQDSETDTDGGFSMVKTKDKIVIFFPLASADPHTSDALTRDLRELASSVTSGKQQLRVVGHADNSGTPTLNLRYGQQRADAIKRILVEFGVPEGNISAESKGETEPVASNETEEGRKKNRRVEVIRLKN